MQPTYQQITTKKSANHGLHLVLTLLTCGLWSPVWLIVAMVGRKETSTLQGFTGQPQQVYPPQQYGQPQAWPQQQYGQQPPSALPPAQQQQPYPPKPEKSPLDGNA